MITDKSHSFGKGNINSKEDDLKEENFSENNFWQNLTEGEVRDIDLYTACAIGKLEYVDRLIHDAKKYGTDIVNKTNSGGWTPIMYVCYVGNDTITELLIREGADILFEDNKYGCTPLMLAASSGNIPLVERLVENNARINRRDKYGRTALFHAVEHGQTDLVKHLLSIGADVLVRQYGTGYTPFMEAAKQGHEKVFGAFLDHGVDLEMICNKGYTSRELAERRGRYVIVNMIDNHILKFPSLRYDAELCDFEKVNKWLIDQDPHLSFYNLSNVSSEMQTHAISIDNQCEKNSSGDNLGKSVGDSTIVDSDRTPVGTPIDSNFQQYMSRDMAQRRSAYETSTVETFLKDLGLEHYVKLFEDEFIDFNTFLSLTEDDFKEIGIKVGSRRKLSAAIKEWKQKTGWVYSKLQHVSADLAREKEARALLEAEQMEERARRNHMYFIAEKVLRACKELQNTTKTLKQHVETLKTVANENKKEDIKPRLKELHKQMSEDTLNADNITATILRRVEKMISDDLTELSGSSDSPESTCTSFSRSGSGTGVTTLE